MKNETPKTQRCSYCHKFVIPFYDDELKSWICPTCHAYFKEEQLEQEEVKAYKCTDCQEITFLKDNKEIRVGFCGKCGHPLWNPAEPVQLLSERKSAKHILDSKGLGFFTNGSCVSYNDTIQLMEEYHSQLTAKPTDEDIEKFAKSFPGNLGNFVLDNAVTAGFIQGAIKMRDGLIPSGTKDEKEGNNPKCDHPADFSYRTKDGRTGCDLCGEKF